MTNNLPNKKRRCLRFYLAAITLSFNLSASSQWNVSTIGLSTIATGLPTTYVMGSATPGIVQPSGIAIIGSNLYVSDTGNNRIVKGNTSGNFAEFAGNGTAGSDDGLGSAATFYSPHGLAVGSDGNLYVADSSNNLIRTITSVGNVTTFAGTGAPGDHNDAPLASTFSDPTGIAFNGNDAYVTDSVNDKVRKISAGAVSDFGILGGFDSPTGIAFNGGDAYVTDSSNNCIKKIAPGGVVTTFAGTGSVGNLDGATLASTFNFPRGIAFDSINNVLYVVDSQNHTIRQITADGTVTTIAGIAGVSGADDGSGNSAKFHTPYGITVGPNGELYVTDTQNHTIRKLVKVTSATPVVPNDGRGRAGGGGGGRAAAAASNATEDDGADADEANFRFKLTTDSLKLSMRANNSNIGNINGNNAYAKTLNDLERSLDSVQGLRQDGGKTFWISGLYDQGKLSAMLGNPAATEHNYGVMVGCHYKDAKTKQIFGVAVDVGIANSIADTDNDLKTDVKSAQLTFYYNKGFAENWKFNIHANYMRAFDRHQRPIAATTGKLLAIAHGIAHEFSLSGEFNYKYKIDGRNDHYFKPFLGFHYAYDLQESYEEKNVGVFNKRYEKSSGDQLGLILGIKANLSYKINETKSFVFLPKLTWTHYVKMLRLKQDSYTISSGARSRASSGTPGRDLLSASLGVGINDSESQTSWKLAYTGNVQKQKKSHEIMLDFGVKF